MFNISEYLKKFAKIEGDSILLRQSVSDALKEVCGVEKADFELKKGILYIKAAPIVKSVIYTKKGALLEVIKRKYPAVIISDVR